MAKSGPRWPMLAAGVLIMAGAAAMLAWNEWRLAARFAAGDELAAALAAGGGEAVHLTGAAAASGGPVRDPLFGLAAQALRLDRVAETYQWREERQGSGGDRMVRYETVWSAEPIPSRRFEQRVGHVNPATLDIPAASFTPDLVTLDGTALAPEVLAALPASEELRPEAQGPVRAAGRSFARSDRWLYSGDPDKPAVGDVRVRFFAAPPGTVSVVGAREGDRVVPFRGRSGQPAARAAYGAVAAEELLGQAAREDWRQAWARRGFAGLMMLVGTVIAGPNLPAVRNQPGGKRRLGILLMLALLLAAGTAALAWLGARILLAAGLPFG